MLSTLSDVLVCLLISCKFCESKRKTARRTAQNAIAMIGQTMYYALAIHDHSHFTQEITTIIQRSHFVYCSHFFIEFS
jgi:hypothetical protein